MKQFRAFAITTLIMMSCLISTRSVSQFSGHPVIDTPAANSIQYLGMKDEMLIFEVRLDSALKSTLSIRDENDNEIYSEKIEKNHFAKRYKISKANPGKIQFHIKGRHYMLSETFNVNYKIEEVLEVAKVK